MNSRELCGGYCVCQIRYSSLNTGRSSVAVGIWATIMGHCWETLLARFGRSILTDRFGADRSTGRYVREFT